MWLQNGLLVALALFSVGNCQRTDVCALPQLFAEFAFLFLPSPEPNPAIAGQCPDYALDTCCDDNYAGILA